MKNSTELIAVIKLYKQYADKGDEILRAQYSADEDPAWAWRSGHLPKNGNIKTAEGTLTYNIHGAGVHIEFPDNRIVDFDYGLISSITLPTNREVATFSLYSLQQFIDSGKANSCLNDKTAAEIAMSYLIRNKIVFPEPYDNPNLPDFLVIPHRFRFI